jgi:hypothetical protein
MQSLLKRAGLGVVGGIAGLAAMEIVQRLTRPLVNKRAPARTEVFATGRSMSLIGQHHRRDESATDALARIAYEKIAHRDPPESTKSALSWAVHLGYGLATAAVYGALPVRARHAVGAGALFGVALWLFGDELVVPLLGLSDRPSAYPAPRHLQSLAAHVAYGVATAVTTKTLVDRTSEGDAQVRTG